jgi:predicted branched-subunit amino acid permease
MTITTCPERPQPTATVPRRSSAILLEGARDMTPMVLGIVPFGIALGTTIAASSLDPWTGLASAPVILAGAAQLATVKMLDAGAAPAVIIVSALLINLRILLYSTSLAPWFADAPLRRRLLLAIPVIDQTHFLCVPRFQRGDLDLRGRTAYYAGAGGGLIVGWLGSQTVAALLGASLPAAARLDMAAPLALVGLLAKSISSRSAAAAATLAIAVTAAGVRLPVRSSTLVATVVAIAVVVGLERLGRAGPHDPERNEPHDDHEETAR